MACCTPLRYGRDDKFVGARWDAERHFRVKDASFTEKSFLNASGPQLVQKSLFWGFIDNCITNVLV